MHINNSIFKLMVEKSVSLQFINEMEIPTSTNLNGNTLPHCFQFVHEILQERDSLHKLSCYLDLTIGNYTCKHLDFFKVLRFSHSIKTFCLYFICERRAVYTLFVTRLCCLYIICLYIIYNKTCCLYIICL